MIAGCFSASRVSSTGIRARGKTFSSRCLGISKQTGQGLILDCRNERHLTANVLRVDLLDCHPPIWREIEVPMKAVICVTGDVRLDADLGP